MANFFPYSNQLEDFFVENGEQITYTKGQHLIWKKDESEWVFFLIKGLVRVSFSLPDDADRIIGYFVPGAIFAQSGSFITQYDGTLFYTAESPTTVVRIKQSQFISAIKKDSSMMMDYLNMTLRNQLLLVDRIVYQGEKGLYGKCVRWLLFMAKYYGEENGVQCEISIPLTQDTIANFLHVTRESVNAILQQLLEENLITISKKRITITHINKLKKLVG